MLIAARARGMDHPHREHGMDGFNGNVPVAPIPDWLVDWKAMMARKFTLAETKAEEKAIRRAMRPAGYRVTSSAGNERVWSRQTKKQADANGPPKRQHTYPL